MKLLIAFMLIIFYSSFANAVNISVVSEACKKEKTKSAFCNQVSEIERNSSKIAEDFLKSFNLEIPLAVGAFVFDPKYSFNYQNHEFKLSPHSINYSFVVKF